MSYKVYVQVIKATNWRLRKETLNALFNNTDNNEIYSVDYGTGSHILDIDALVDNLKEEGKL